MSVTVDSKFFELLSSSYSRLVGETLVPGAGSDQDAALWLYEEAPFCVLAHNTEPDPRFVYANKAAQSCFEYSWEEVTSLPSRLSAEAPQREDRQRFLDTVARQGFVKDYRGLRVAKSGRRFWIEDGTVWQVIDDQGILHGQAVVFRNWQDQPLAG